jgi:DNA polymerase-3 subunit alpha
LCREGADWRYGAPGRDVLNRLEYELDTIVKMGYTDYFLIVWDFVRYAREAGIAVGPGRGSAAGSLVAYVLGITDVDPIKYRLLFERFLNPQRVSMPDIDIDFDDERRGEVIAYVMQKYGADRVAQIITFGTMAARAVIRDVGRVIQTPHDLVDRAAKMIPARPGMTLKKALEESEGLKAFVETNEEVRQLFRLAYALEGLPRHTSIHAAGVVISSEPLYCHVPLQKGMDGYLTQFSMDHLERLGLLKMDFLGLKTLTVIERTLSILRKTEGIVIDWNRIDTDDERVYELLGKGMTTGVFQLESAGMRRVLEQLQPRRFEDIAAVNALYRPGPMENIRHYIAARKSAASVAYPHPDLEEILRPTYGFIIYQEQIMQIASKLAGFSLAEADLLRRAVSKKKREILDEEREHFVAGCIGKGYPASLGHEVYDLIVRFADYGFNRSHAVAYAVLAFRTAYLKAHFPVAFMAALLTSVIGSQDKVSQYVQECRDLGLGILGPDVNKSEAGFTAEGRAIRFGLGSIKNVGIQAVRAIIKAREENGPFRDFFDAVNRLDSRACTKKVFESLICAGAFDAFSGHRAQYLAVLDEALEKARKHGGGQMAFAELEQESLTYPQVRPFPEKEKLALEQAFLGVYLHGHPAESYEEAFALQDTMMLSEVSGLKPSHLRVAGLLQAIRRVRTKRGEWMAFMRLEDSTGGIDAVVFPRVYARIQPLLADGSAVLIEGRLDAQEEKLQIVAERIEPVAETGDGDFQVIIRIDRQSDDARGLQRLQQVLAKHRGRRGVMLYYSYKKMMRDLSRTYRVHYSRQFIRDIEQLLGKRALHIKNQPNKLMTDI